MIIMKRFFVFFLTLYNELLYNGIRRRFRKAVELLPELGGEIEILEIGFGTGTGDVSVISPFSIKTPFLYYENEPMYFAKVKTKLGETGYLYAVKCNDFFIEFFQRIEKYKKIDFAFNFEGNITKTGKISFA